MKPAALSLQVMRQILRLSCLPGYSTSSLMIKGEHKFFIDFTKIGTYEKSNTNVLWSIWKEDGIINNIQYCMYASF